MNITADTLGILFLLMPGFIATRVLDLAITRQAPSTASTLVEALIFSFLIYVCSSLFFEWTPLIVTRDMDGGVTYEFSENHKLVVFVLVASIVFPAIVGAFIHHDWHTAILRKLRITDKTSRSSVWQDVYTSEKRHIVVHIADGHRIYGWPMYYSHDPSDSYIYLFQPAWVTNDNNYLETNNHGILIRNDMIKFVEFMKHPGENLKTAAKEVV